MQANAGTPGTNTQISISDDGAVVALGTSGGGSVTSGYFNFWVNKNFWTSPNTNADAITLVTAGASAVKVCGQGDIIYGGGNSGSQGLFRWNSSQFRSGGLKETITAVTNSSFGTAIRSIGCSLDGNRAVLASPFSSTVDSRVVVTSNKFISGNYYPANFSSNNLTQSDAQRPWSVHMSADGKFVTVGTGSSLGSNNGTTQVSSDYGVSLTNTSFINRYMQTITISDSGSRIITGGGVGSTKVVILSSS